MFSRLVLLCLFGLLIGLTAAQERRSGYPFVEEEESFPHPRSLGSDKPNMVAASMELTISLGNGNDYAWIINYKPEEGFKQHLYRKKIDALPLPILRKSLPPFIFT